MGHGFAASKAEWTGTPTVTVVTFDPVDAPGACTAAQVTTGTGNCTNGVHYFRISFVTSYGETELGTASSAVTVDASHKQVALTAIPTGPVGVIARNVYATAAGGSRYYLATQLADNSTTTYTFNLADTSLGTDDETDRVNTTAQIPCPLELYKNSVATAQTVGLALINDSEATSGAQQYSPVLYLRGYGFETTGSTSQSFDMGLQVRPVQGATTGGYLDILGRTTGGSWSATAVASFSSGGGVVVGGSITADSLALSKAGTIKANMDQITLTNTVNAADMDATATSILWNQWYYDAVTPAVADCGRIGFTAETDWTSTASTQDSFFHVDTCHGGTVGEKVRVDSHGSTTITQLAGSTGLPTALSVSGGNHTDLTVATLAKDVYFDLSGTKTWATGGGTLAAQYDVGIAARTYAAAAAMTITNGSTFYVSGAPTQGTNITLSNAWAIYSGGANYLSSLKLGTDLPVSEGGTGASTLTQYGVLVGDGTGAVQATAAGGAGTVLRGAGSANPAWSTFTIADTYTAGDLLHASSTNTVTSLADVAVGQVLISGGVGAAPSYSATPYVSRLGIGAAADATQLLWVWGGDATIVGAGTLGSETLSNGNLTSGTDWTAAADCALAADAATWTYSGGLASTLTQASAKLTAPLASRWYKFGYTISSAGTAAAASITTSFAESSTALNCTDGSHVTYFRSASSPGDFVITSTLTSSDGNFTIDSLSLKELQDGDLEVGGALRARSMTLVSDLAVAEGGTGCSTVTQYGVVVGAGSNPLQATAAGAAGTVLQGAGSANPGWSTATYPSTATGTGTILRADGTNWAASTATLADTYVAGDILHASGANTVTGLTAVATGSVLVSAGASTAPQWSTTPSILSDGVTTGDGVTISADALTTGTALFVDSTSTAGGASGASYAVRVTRSGVNAQASHTAYGVHASVTNSGTTSTNYGLYATASGATNNYAAYLLGKTGINVAPQNYCALRTGWNAATMAAGTTAARHVEITGNITELADAAITDIAGLYCNTFTVVDGGGAETVGLLSTVYIAGAPTAGSTPTTGPYALFVDAGKTRLDGDVQLGTASTIGHVWTASDTAGNGGWAAVTAGISGSGTSGQIPVFSGATAIGDPTSGGTISMTGIGTAQTMGITLENTTAAANGAQQYSPMAVQAGKGWGTGGSGSTVVEWATQVRPIQGTTAYSVLDFLSRVGGSGSWTTRATLDTHNSSAFGLGYLATATNNSVALGYNVGWSTGTSFVAVGNNALYNCGANNINYSVAIGAQALQSTAGNTASAVAVGWAALYQSIGDNNTAVGTNALLGVAGGNNTAYGYMAGNGLVTYPYTHLTGTGNVFVGYNTATNGQQLFTASNSIAIGSGAYTMASNQAVLGDWTVTDTHLRGNTHVLDATDLGSESLTNGALTSGTSWSAGGSCSLASDAATFSGSGTLTQASGDLAVAGVASRWYKLVYTISGRSGTPAATITTGFAASAETLYVSADGTYTKYFKAAASPGDFVISATAGTFTIDTLSLNEITGGDLEVGGKLHGGNGSGLQIHNTGWVTADAMLQGKQGTDVASANDMVLTLDGNYFDITGTTQINTISTTNIQAGTIIVLQFDDAPTVKHDQAHGAGYGGIMLGGGSDFSATAGDMLTLAFDGTHWREVARTAI